MTNEEYTGPRLGNSLACNMLRKMVDIYKEIYPLFPKRTLDLGTNSRKNEGDLEPVLIENQF